MKTEHTEHEMATTAAVQSEPEAKRSFALRSAELRSASASDEASRAVSFHEHRQAPPLPWSTRRKQPAIRPAGLIRSVLALLFITLQVRAAAPANYSDPASYPTAWPSQLASQAYTMQGAAQFDKTGVADTSKNSTPSGGLDFSSGLLNSSPSFYYYGNGSVLYFRVRLASSPLASTGSGAPYISGAWNFLLDTDGDGFREFAVQLDGTGNGSAPGDVVVYYANTASQTLGAGSVLWRQDSARHPTDRSGDGVDGEPGTSASWDSDASPYVWDFGRTRVVQIDTTQLPGSANSEYFLDIQVPLAAFDATALGGPVLAANTPFTLAATTGTSSSDPTGVDLVNGGVFTLANAAVPVGDVTSASGAIVQAPVVMSVTASASPAPFLLTATVLDATTGAGSVVSDTLALVKFEQYFDANGDGAANDGNAWTLIGNASRTNTLGQWVATWDSSSLPRGKYLVRAVATDAQANTTTSTDQAAFFPAGVTAVLDNTSGIATMTITGTVYNDLNHDARLTPGETGTGLALFAKLVSVSAPAGPAVQVALVDPVSGGYTFAGVVPGTNTIVIDDNLLPTDVTPTIPAGWAGTEAPAQSRTVVVGTGNLANQNFGLIFASALRGSVFKDNGAGGGTANDGIRNGGEAGLAGVTVRLTDSTGSTVMDSATTDGSGNFSLFVPATVLTGTQLKIVEVNPTGHLSTGASVGNTGGSYSRANDAVTFTYIVGTSYTGVNFGDVPDNSFTNDGQKFAQPGNVTFYPHTFTAGSGGQVTFSVASLPSPSLSGWNQVIYRDSNGNGQLDAGEPALTGPVTVVADEQVRLLVKEFVPVNASLGARDQLTVTAQFTYMGASPSLTASYTRTDVTTVGVPLTDGLTLTKTVDQSAAAPGSTITYTVTYRNAGTDALGNVVIQDATPAFTTFVSAGNGALPAGLTAVSTSTPAANGTGAVRWTFTGSLAPGGSGTVTYSVRVK